ncbi:MAG: CxxC-x17-CxxC domain-containing protein [archaeon]
MHTTYDDGTPTVCADCKATGFGVPFQPKKDRDLYCQNCIKNHQKPRRF